MGNLPVLCGVADMKGTTAFVLPLVGKTQAERIFGATFLKEKSLWIFPGYYPYALDVVADIQTVFPQVTFTDKAKQHIGALQNLDAAIKSGGVAYNQGFKFITKPYAHQEESLKFAIAHPRCGLFLDMGLGKTKVVIDLIRHQKVKTLVLAPSIVVGIWPKEIAIHAGKELSAVALSGTVKKRAELIKQAAKSDVTVVSYDTAKRDFDAIMAEIPYEMIVADESHNLRGYNSARTKCAIALASKAPKRVLVSGTPSLGNPFHLFGQLSFLGKYIPGKSFWDFRTQHAVISPYNSKIITGFKNLGILNDKVARISVRKKKEDCLDLPERIVQDIYFEPDAEQRRVYNEMVETECAELATGEEVEAANAAVVIQKLLQVLSGFMIVPPPRICTNCKYIQQCVELGNRPYTQSCRIEQEPPPQKLLTLKSNPKLDTLSELLEDILAEERNKVLVWAYFKHELSDVEALLKSKEIGYIRVDGSNSNKGPVYAQEFNTDPKIRVWLGQISTGIGVTLNSAAYTIYYGHSYGLDHYQQSRDRNYRIGQKSTVLEYRLTCKDSVIEFVLKALDQKQNIATLLTTKINCVMCRQNIMCLADGVEPFTPGCIHPDKYSRVITTPKILEESGIRT